MHDVNGKLIQVGDEAVLRCKVVWVGEGEEYCNVTLDTVHSMPPYIEPTRFSQVNARQIEVVCDPQAYNSDGTPRTP